MKFTKKRIERYSRQIILKKIGVIGQKKLLKSSVLIIGAGGLGSPIAIYLAALGIGKIGIIDKDKVEISNLSRQIIFSTSDVKKSKSSIAIDKLKRMNPDIKLRSFNKRLTEKNINQIAKNFDLIVDGSDNFRTRFLINDYCFRSKKILISGATRLYILITSHCLGCQAHDGLEKCSSSGVQNCCDVLLCPRCIPTLSTPRD